MPPSSPDPDALMERALEIALSRPEGWRSIPAEIALQNPGATVLDLAVALARAASALEETFRPHERDGLPARLHRLASQAVVDGWSMRRHGPLDARAAELVAFRITRERGGGRGV